MPKQTPTQKLALVKRRKTVAANILAGATYSDIASLLDVSESTICRDFQATLAEWQKHYDLDTARWVSIQLRRLDMMLNALWSDAQGGNHQAIDRVLKIMERQAKLLGLDAPTDVNLGISPKAAQEIQRLGFSIADVIRELESLLIG